MPDGGLRHGWWRCARVSEFSQGPLSPRRWPLSAVTVQGMTRHSLFLSSPFLDGRGDFWFSLSVNHSGPSDTVIPLETCYLCGMSSGQGEQDCQIDLDVSGPCCVKKLWVQRYANTGLRRDVDVFQPHDGELFLERWEAFCLTFRGSLARHFCDAGFPFFDHFFASGWRIAVSPVLRQRCWSWYNFLRLWQNRRRCPRPSASPAESFCLVLPRVRRPAVQAKGSGPVW